MVEIELDKETGHIEILDYVAVVDCGTPVNPNLARVQVEGGLGQGIGMALYEGVDYTPNGYVKQNSFMQYKVPARVDVGKLRVEFESSYEPTGPFGAKSIGEIVINTPSPALAMPYLMQPDYGSENCRSPVKRSLWDYWRKNNITWIK